ncbi:2OG-Fe(II) oxygenase [Flavobacteriaceae bacterium KMM 6897]|nr:2OG-Fe(II) oxygenase [Flavobacteriaceae bacterium KMM 6897]
MELFEELEFKEDPLYEKVIDDLLAQKYSIVDDFFSPREILTLRNSLLSKYEEDQFIKAAIGSRSNKMIVNAIRGDFILWMDEKAHEEAEKLFFAKINEFANYLNKTCFLGILHKEFHYALYPQGTFYKRHLDTFQNDDRRKLSIALYLNESTWKPEYGGELAIYLPEGVEEKTIKILPLQGRMVIFESQELEHEVKTANQNRLSITGWLKTR